MCKIVRKHTVSANLINGIDIVEQDVDVDNGQIATLIKIHTPEVSMIIPIMENKTFLFVRQFRHNVGDQILEFPAGKIQNMESPEDCAIRELEEETGCVSSHLYKLASLYASPEFTDELVHIFVADQLRKGTQKPEPYERIELVQMTLNQTLDYISRPDQRTDAKSLAAILILLNKGDIFNPINNHSWID